MPAQLPAPLVHYDAIRNSGSKSGVAIVDQVLSLPPEKKLKIIHDPVGRFHGVGWLASLVSAGYSTTYTMMRCMLQYEWERQQVVCVGPKMQAAFANTSLENVPLDMVRLPYPCFYLATPESEDLFLWGGDRTQWHQVAGMYVRKESASNALSILAWGSPNERSLDPHDDATFWFRIDLDEAFSSMEQSFDKAMDSQHVRETLRNVEEESRRVETDLRKAAERNPQALRQLDMENALKKLLSNAKNDASDPRSSLEYNGNLSLGKVPLDKIERVRSTALGLMRIAVNTVLYMNSTGADISNPETNEGERARLQKKLAGFKNPKKKDARIVRNKLSNLSASRVVWIGPSIEQSEPGGERDLTGGTGRRVSGHVRRGHWHTFLVGPRKREGEVIEASERGRTLKWIPPLWVGGVAKGTTERRVYGIRE